MAPNTGTAEAPRQQTRRTVPRIVPAIPLALTRTPPIARPITPEDTATEAVTQHDPGPQPAVERDIHDHGQHTIEDPPTPQSKASVVMQGDQVDVTTPVSSTSLPENTVDTQDRPASPSITPEPEPVKTSAVSYEERPSTRSPPFEGTEAPFQPQSTSLPSHNLRSSLDGIVFGATQESPALPSTPQEPELENRVPAQPLPRHPPGFVSPQLAPPLYSSHSHHHLVTQVDWVHPTLAVAAADGTHRQTEDFHPSAYPGSITYQGAQPGHFSPGHVNAYFNGAARSQSQSPAKSQLSETRPDSDHGEEQYSAHYQNGIRLPTTGANLPSLELAKFKEPFELAGYLTAQLGNPEFTDFVLRVHSQDTVLLTIPVHGIIVARSRTILSSLRNSLATTSQPKGTPSLIDILTRDQLITAASLNEGIKVLYGAPLLSVESFLYRLSPFHPDGEDSPAFNEARGRMSQAISYTAAGEFLQLHGMHERGIETIKALLRWDTFDQAMSFLLLSGLYSQGRSTNRTYHDTTSNPTTHHATKLLDDDVINFIAYNFPVGFNLHTIAPEMKLTPRLPSVVEGTMHKARLSRIRFGDVPPEDELKPDYITRVLSSVLLSLPLPLLDRLLNHRVVLNQLGWRAVEKVMHDVIGEREKRRVKAMKSQIGIPEMESGSNPKSLLENMFWEERVVPSPKHLSGYTLSESRVADHV